MAQKAITIYTPPTANPHIYAEDEAQTNRARFGGSGILDVDGSLACTAIDNNTVRLASGMYCCQGYLLSVPGGSTEDLPVISGTAGMYRKDLVIAEFIRGGGAVADELVFRVLKGTAAATEAAAVPPTLTQDNLGAGGSVRQEALYQINLYGISIQTITRIASFVGNFYA